MGELAALAAVSAAWSASLRSRRNQTMIGACGIADWSFAAQVLGAVAANALWWCSRESAPKQQNTILSTLVPSPSAASTVFIAIDAARSGGKPKAPVEIAG